ncbi:MAG: hypothetical protein R3D34_16700 [Nitratireductor sp.]
MGSENEKSAQWSKKWHLMVAAAKQSLEEKGYDLERVPGRGLSNIWKVTKDGKTQTASIRTTQDRWFAFPPLENGAKWKTLDDADIVVVAAVDDREDPTAIEVYIFPASEVRKRFDEAYAARVDGGLTVRNNFGMWVSLDKDERGIPASVGSGIIEQYPAVGTYALDEVAPSEDDAEPDFDESGEGQAMPEPPKTIGDVLFLARHQIATIAGVDSEAVKLDLKIEY